MEKKITNDINFLDLILYNLHRRNKSILTMDNISRLNDIAIDNLVDENQDIIFKLIMISNIIYNNTDKEIMPINDDLYDKLMEIHKRQYPNDYIIGSPIIDFSSTNNIENKEILVVPASKIDRSIIEDNLYITDINNYSYMNIKPSVKIVPAYTNNPIDNNEKYINKRLNVNIQEYPELVGTLDKCKFVLDSTARDLGVYDDSNVSILERDFFRKHIEEGIIDKNTELYILVMLKYDGISLVANCNSRIISANTRGDVNSNVTSDLSELLSGYYFPNSILNDISDPYTIKFEAIMRYPEIYEYSSLSGKNYKNCRSAVVGLTSYSEGYKYRDLLTLVPLQMQKSNMNRVEELVFLNKHFSTREMNRFVVMKGNYLSILFQIKRFVEEMEYMRDSLPFMYDGIVVEYLNEDIVNKLGRKNSVNQYQMAVKFQPLKHQSKVVNVSFTIGQNGIITPMVHYLPVGFYGTIHDKSTLNSYDRFISMNLRYGDIIDISYNGDVMPYVTKPCNSYNENNNGYKFEAITHCPECNLLLDTSTSGKTMVCMNIRCPGRNRTRLSNMMDKLNLKDFGEANLDKLPFVTLAEYLKCEMKDLDKTTLGPKQKEMFLDRMNYLKTQPIKDYILIGSLGFSNIAKGTWKKILNNYTIREIISMMYETNNLYEKLLDIKGIGESTISTIYNEIEFFLEDISTILELCKGYINTKNEKSLKIRFTGFRNQDIVDRGLSLGYDIGEGSVTKDTNVLIIPNTDYNTGSKYINAIKYGVEILDIDSFVDKYL